MDETSLSYLTAFVAGVFTFLSPCFLPLVPSYIVYLTGISFEDLSKSDKRTGLRKKTLIHSLFFILGFSAVFILLGLTASAIGRLLFQYQKAIRLGGGLLIIILGLNFMGILKFDLLLKERKIHLANLGIGYLSSFLVGVTFAAAWTPCAGAILGSILVLAGERASLASGAKFLVAYSLGIAAPFFISSLFINWFIIYLKRARRFLGAMTYVSGIFLVLLGLALATDYFQVAANFLNRTVGR
jgi:cytochrome c-type biogenesis protein